MSFQSFAQKNETQRLKTIERTLDSLQTSIAGLNQTVNFNISNVELPSFIRTVGATRKVNVSIAHSLKSIVLTHNFSNATVKDVLLYLCKEYQLNIDVTGNIISLKKHEYKKPKPVYKPKEILANYNSVKDHLSIDLQNDTLSVVFKKITDITGKNLVFSPGLGTKKVSVYIKNKSFDSAMDKLAFSNDLLVTKTKDNYYLFESHNYPITTKGNNKKQRPNRYRNSNFYYVVKDSITKTLDVDFENTPISSIIKDIALDLNINMFTSTPLNGIGSASVKATNITFDVLLTKILEDTKFNFKKENDIYFFGKREQASLRSTETVPLLHRSIEIMNEPMQSGARSNFNSNINTGSVYNDNFNSNSNFNQNFNNQNFNNQSFNRNNRQNINTQRNQSFGNYNSKSEALVNILPKEIVKDLEITSDVERNSFIVSGDAQKIEKFKKFIKTIDQPIPVVLIEVMILEVSKSASISAGVELGLGNEPTKDSGTLFSSTDVTLGATTINKIIGDFNGFGALNVGKVVPNFYAKIQAMETNGDVKIKSTPKLSTLNGHRAVFTSGQRSYYAVTRRDIIGSQNPQTREIKNYVPVDADLSIAIRPLVSEDNQITLSINVLQSNFNGERIDPEAPPGMNSREFTSTVRVQDQDVVILGGLEENVKSNTGSGVPFLAKIPVIKWLFSKRVRNGSKSKLSVLIKPTVIK